MLRKYYWGQIEFFKIRSGSIYKSRFKFRHPTVTAIIEIINMHFIECFQHSVKKAIAIGKLAHKCHILESEIQMRELRRKISSLHSRRVTRAISNDPCDLLSGQIIQFSC